MDQVIRISDWSDCYLSWARHWHTHLFYRISAGKQGGFHPFLEHCLRALCARQCAVYSESLTYQPSSWELSKMWTCVPSTSVDLWVKLQLAFRLLLLTVLHSTISHHPPLLPSVTLLACSLDASPCMPAIILDYYFSNFCTVRFKMVSLFFVFYVLFVWKV